MTEQRNAKRLPLILAVMVLSGMAVAWWFLGAGLEGKAPRLVWEEPLGPIGPSVTLKGVAQDPESGLKRIWVALLQQDKEVVLLDRRFPSEGLLKKGSVRRQPIAIAVNPAKLGLHDGDAILRTAVWDYAYRDWLSGNRAYVERKVTIDTTAPDVALLSRVHNLNQGGSGLAVYRVSEPVRTTGVYVAHRFFPGLSGYFSDDKVFVAFFAVSYDQEPQVQPYISATDRAGNPARLSVPCYINGKPFPSDTIRISDAFLDRKMPEFEHQGGTSTSGSRLETFLYVNRELRKANYETIRAVCNTSDATKAWDGRFLRLPGSARKAGFAEQRTYRYRGKTIDKQVHLGIDLASTAHCPVPAANSGRVAFAGKLGIYGGTVILDHGFYLFSMYSHLSRIVAEKGRKVNKGDIIGYSGATGMAGGDHLHYAMLIHDTFVNPVEWWDAEWIKNHITDKLERVAQHLETDKEEANP